MAEKKKAAKPKPKPKAVTSAPASSVDLEERRRANAETMKKMREDAIAKAEADKANQLKKLVAETQKASKEFENDLAGYIIPYEEEMGDGKKVIVPALVTGYEEVDVRDEQGRFVIDAISGRRTKKLKRHVWVFTRRAANPFKALI